MQMVNMESTSILTKYNSKKNIITYKRILKLTLNAYLFLSKIKLYL